MSFDHVLGQPAAVQTLQAALDSGRIHHAYRFEGPSGVGKELCAMVFAHALILGGAQSDRAHGFRLNDDPPHLPLHPDLVLIGRGLYRDAIDQSEATGISVEQIRKVVLARVGFAPHQGQALVFIIRDAEELTVSAANALLKTLEEPRPNVHFVLLTSNPERLLDTVRSRTLPIRFGPLPDGVLERVLSAAGKPKELAALAQGSAELALQLGDAELRQSRDEFLSAAVNAMTAPHFSAALDVAADLPKERDTLRQHLRALAQHFALDARSTLQRDPKRAQAAAEHFSTVLEAVAAIERNVNPTLVVEAMLSRLRRT
ncbi:MAG TPA: DNA polymerase III subunit [Polyangiaceae bacterium]|nr:DNA polymerase III subunit [Polyangiaceae bacterium]